MANNTVVNAGPQPLGRTLSEANTVTVNLIEPNTLFGERRNNIDLRLSKILRYSRTRTQVGIDIYNLMNSDTITAYSQTFSPTSTTLAERTDHRAGAVRSLQRAVRLLDRPATVGDALKGVPYTLFSSSQ